MSKLQKKPSALKREHTALQNMKFQKKILFLGHFCPPGSGSGSPVPDPDFGSGSGYRSTDLIESGSKTLVNSEVPFLRTRDRCSLRTEYPKFLNFRVSDPPAAGNPSSETFPQL
jgi:hypothetical protein